MSHEILLILLGVLLFGGILSGAPVSFVLLGAPFLVASLGAATGSFDLAFVNAFPSRAFGLLTNPIFVAVPLFVLMGSLLEKADIARRMMLTAGMLFGEHRGGLAFAVIIVGALLAASTGVIGATILMLGMIALPAMLGANYSPRLASGVICASGSLGQIIPPSILLILLADQISAAYQSGRRSVGDFAPEPVSVGDLFAGALLPGLLLVGLYLLYVLAVSLLRPETCPPIRRSELAGGQPKIPFGEVVKALVLPLALILLVLGSILGGVATPTEAAGVGAAAALLIALGYRTLTWEGLRTACLATVRTSAMLFFIIISAKVMAMALAYYGVPPMMRDFALTLGSPYLLLLLISAIYLFLGTVFEDFSLMIILLPFVLPMVRAAGFDIVWFGVFMTVLLQAGLLSPPVGLNLFVIQGVTGARLSEVIWGSLPFLVLLLTVGVLLVFFPALALWLPSLWIG